jgi:hypothetical protein
MNYVFGAFIVLITVLGLVAAGYVVYSMSKIIFQEVVGLLNRKNKND